ncbi:MAG: hypothetical protein ACP6IY_19580 [Promethearchaeia archaeon]
MDIIYSVLLELQPCSSAEILDFINSNLFYYRGYKNPGELTLSQINYYLKKIIRNSAKIFRFECENGYKIRFGLSKYHGYTPSEPRYLKVQGNIEHCMYCGMPIYNHHGKEYHFEYNCDKYDEQSEYKLIKVGKIYAIISRQYIHGILDDLQSCYLRLPGKNGNLTHKNIFSELWVINEHARKNGLIDADQLLTLKAEEFISLK